VRGVFRITTVRQTCIRRRGIPACRATVLVMALLPISWTATSGTVSWTMK